MLETEDAMIQSVLVGVDFSEASRQALNQGRSMAEKLCVPLTAMLPLVLDTPKGSLHINRQNVKRMVLRAIDTRGIVAGITGTTLEAIVEREGGEIGLDDVHQRDYDISPPGHWEPSTTVTIQQNQPLPAHITGVFLDMLVSPK